MNRATVGRWRGGTMRVLMRLRRALARLVSLDPLTRA
jgi:hypothetical protein